MKMNLCNRSVFRQRLEVELKGEISCCYWCRLCGAFSSPLNKIISFSLNHWIFLFYSCWLNMALQAQPKRITTLQMVMTPPTSILSVWEEPSLDSEDLSIFFSSPHANQQNICAENMFRIFLSGKDFSKWFSLPIEEDKNNVLHSWNTL